MEESRINKSGFFLIAIIVGVFYIINIYNSPLFYSLSDLFNIAIISGIILVIWSNRNSEENSFFIFLGIMFISAGIFELFHLFFYSPLNQITNQFSQLWIAAGYFKAFAFLLAPFYINRKINFQAIFGIISLIAALILSLFLVRTEFNQLNFYLILIYTAAAAFFFKNRFSFNKSVANFLASSLISLTAAEVLFLIDFHPLIDFSGHIFKAAGIIFIYKSFIAAKFRDPLRDVFKNFKNTSKDFENSDIEFKPIIESFLDAVILCNENGNIIYSNEAAEKIFEYTNSEIINMPISKVIPEEYILRSFKGIGKIRNVSKKMEIFCVSKNGNKFPAEILFFSWKSAGKLFSCFIMRDVTVNRLVEEILDQSENRFKSLFYQSPVGKELYDSEGNFISANKAALKIFGVTHIDKKRQYNLFKNPYLTDQEIEKLRQGQIIKIEYEISPTVLREYGLFKKNRAESLYINELITPVILEKEINPKNYLVHIQDVTEKTIMSKLLEKAKRFAEKRAKEAEKRKIILETIINYIPEGVVVADMPDKKIRMINKYGKDTIGGNFNELEGILISECVPWLGILNPATKEFARPDSLPLNKAIIDGEFVKDEEWLLKGNKGKFIPISCSAGPIKDKNGSITGAIMVWHDMTMRKKNELRIKFHAERLEKLANDLQKFKLAVENASDLIVITDSEGEIIYVNNTTCQITGFSNSEILGQKSMPWGGNMPKEFYQKMWDTIKTEKRPFFGELVNVKKTGERFDAEIHISPVMDDKGKIIFFVGISRDITKAKEIDKTKSEFISMASHQLRTPLASTSLSIELLLKGAAGEFNKEQKKYLRQIHSDIWGMAGLIDAFLNISRIEMGIFIMDPKPTDVKRVADSSVMKVQSQLEQKKIKLERHYQKNLPIINIDPIMIKTVIENLLTNSVKYTPEKGKITVEVESKRQKIIITISDTGYGIPKNQQRHIFKKLFRASNTSKTEGMGLGLYVVKSIVKKLGGEVSFKSRENKGTSFNIIIPIKKINVMSGSTRLR